MKGRRFLKLLSLVVSLCFLFMMLPLNAMAGSFGNVSSRFIINDANDEGSLQSATPAPEQTDLQTPEPTDLQSPPAPTDETPSPSELQVTPAPSPEVTEPVNSPAPSDNGSSSLRIPQIVTGVNTLDIYVYLGPNESTLVQHITLSNLTDTQITNLQAVSKEALVTALEGYTFIVGVSNPCLAAELYQNGQTKMDPATLSGTSYSVLIHVRSAQFNVNFITSGPGSLTGTTSFLNIDYGTAWGTAVTVPTPVPNTGAHFVGWSPAFPSTVTSSQTYTATFALDTYNVTFITSGPGSLTGTASFTSIPYGTAWGTAVTVPTPVPNTGAHFVGWSPAFPSTVTATQTYTATFALDTFDVTFDTSGPGSLTGTTSYSGIPYGTAWGTAVTVPTPVANLGAHFVGWSPSFPSTVTATQTYTATFALDTFDVTFDTSGPGSLTGTASFTSIPYGTAWGTAVTVPTPVANLGAHFVGWSPSFPSTVTATQTYTATFALDTFDVTFDTSGPGSLTGTTSFSGIDYGTAWGTAVTVPTPVANLGAHFVGWSPSFPSTVTTTQTYTATFALDKFDVTFDTSGPGSLTGTTSFGGIDYGTAWGTAVTVPTPVANLGAHFVGWSPSFPSTVTTTQTYTATFALDTFDVTFDTSGPGSLTGTTSFSNIDYGTAWGTAVTVPTPVANLGAHFVGWSPSFPSTVTTTQTYTATFALDTFDVTFDTSGPGSLTGTTSFGSIDYGTAWGTAVTVPTPVANLGAHFVGWSPSFPSTVTATQTYTATFALDTFDVTFNTSGPGSLTGTTSYSGIDYGTAWGTAVTVPTPAPNPGAYFVGWSASFPSDVTANLTFTATFATKTAIVLTAGSATVTYDGVSHSVTTYSGTPAGLTINGVTAFGSGTAVGSYPVTFTLGNVTVFQGATDVTDQYSIGYVNGTLTINAAVVPPPVITTPTPAPTVIPNPPVPGGPPASGWSLLNLILAIGTALTAAGLLVGYTRKSYLADGSEADQRRKGFMRLFSLVPGVGAIVAFLLTENMKNPMIITDMWTILMVAIAVVQAVVLYLSKRNAGNAEKVIPQM